MVLKRLLVDTCILLDLINKRFNVLTRINDLGYTPFVLLRSIQDIKYGPIAQKRRITQFLKGCQVLMPIGGKSFDQYCLNMEPHSFTILTYDKSLKRGLKSNSFRVLDGAILKQNSPQSMGY